MKVTAVSTIRQLVLSLLLMISGVPAFAGGPLLVPKLVENDPTTTDDDQMKPMKMSWPDILSPPRFYYQAYQPGDIITLPGVIYPKESLRPSREETLRAMNAAVKTWNRAKFSNFEIADGVISTIYAPPIPFTYPPISTYGIALDGYNVISFIDETPFGSDETICLPIMSYFNHDYDPTLLIGQTGVPLQFLGGIYFGTQADGTVLVYDFDGDQIMDLWLPYTEYKAGDFIDVDLCINPGATQWLRAWPEKYSDIPDGDKPDVIGSLDIQMLMTHLFGFATGMGVSNVTAAVMHPYFESAASVFPTDPYQKRILAFDDEMNVGITTGSFPSACASIGGQILEGALIDGTVDNDEGLDLYVSQANVFLYVRPETLAQSSWLNCGRSIRTIGRDPDNYESTPVIPDANQGTYRMIAETLSGSNLALPVGRGDDIFFWITSDTVEDATQPGGNPLYQDVTFFTDAGTLIEDGIYSSDYRFPGLVATDDNGSTISYAVSLDRVVAIGDTGGGDATDVLLPINAIQTWFPEVFEPEFYGGTVTALTVGNGTAVDENIRQDNFFENEYVTAEVDQAGRISAAINQGPPFLSGFNQGPRSYLILETDKGKYTNREGAIGITNEAVVIDDAANTANGSWMRTKDFNLRQQISVTDRGALTGVPTGLLISYTLSNNGDTTNTYNLRQILDTVQFGIENPLFVVNSQALYHEITFAGGSVPNRLDYQTSLRNPTFSSFITLRGQNLYTPDEVTIAKLKNLTKSFSSEGALIGGPGANGDTGVSLLWKNVKLAPGESRRASFIIGFFQPGSVQDGYETATYNEETGELESGNDDPYHIETIELSNGETRDNIDIITNTGTSTTGGTTGGDDYVPPPNTDVYPGQQLTFFLKADAFPDTDYISMTGAVGDIDNDGDLDVVTAGYGGGVAPVAGRLNRVYLNKQRIEADGSVTYFFEDNTFGNDGVLGTMDDRLKEMRTDDGGKTYYAVDAPTESTVGVVLADFNNDGYLDVFFTNQPPFTPYEIALGLGEAAVGGSNRLYLNTQGDDGTWGYFIDASKQWLPGLLNLKWGEVYDYPMRATAGDIDSDGDMDLIISEILPMYDDITFPTCAFIDASPAGDSENYRLGDQRPNMTGDFWSGPLQFTERVLINQVNHPPYDYSPQAELFKDETLGSDDYFGSMTSMEIDYNPDPMFGVQVLRSWQPSEIDRMPPVFPYLVQFASATARTITNSPMASCASEPHLGPIESHASLDLVSIRPYSEGDYGVMGLYPFTTAPPADPPSTVDPPPESVVTMTQWLGAWGYMGTDQGVFRNVDLFTNDAANISPYDPIGKQYNLLAPDGVPDGYFYCVNYGDDYWRSNMMHYNHMPGLNFLTALDENGDLVTTGTVYARSGLFAFQVDPATLEFRYDANPLLIGLPDSLSADYKPNDVNDGGEIDGVPGGSLAWTGLIADFENGGIGNILVASDNDGEGGNRYPFYIMEPSHRTDQMANPGVSRLGSYGGYGFTYLPNDPVVYYNPFTWDAAGVLQLPLPPSPELLGEPYGSTSADFDQDGDMDIYVGTTTQIGISSSGGGLWIVNDAFPDRFYLNDSWGVTVEASSLVSAAGPVITAHVLHADYDNDGDEDLIIFNAQHPNQVLENQIYITPPDTNDETDGKMFHNESLSMTPPLIDVAIAPPLPMLPWPVGVTLRTVMADLNSDGLPDMLKACGGYYTHSGDYDQILINTGQPKHGGTRTFKPYNAAYPGPAVGAATAYTPYYQTFAGLIGARGFNSDVAAGDVDNDGDNDIILVRQERSGLTEMMELYTNEDVDELPLNSVPDANSLGDGYFVEATPGLWPEIETPGTALGGLNLKRQAKRVLFADFNNDGRADILIGNGMEGTGAPNVLLLNKPIGTQPYNFIDATETNLPLGSDGIRGVIDNTNDMAVGDFDSDGNVDIVFANRTLPQVPIGFRYLRNTGDAMFVDDDPTHQADDTMRRIPKFLDRVPRGIVAADFDGLGEPTEDKNHNGHLDPGEDTNGNGVLDWTDYPTETEDINGNGQLDEGEDGLIDSNGSLDQTDRNGDGIITAYRDGIWDGSLDLFVSFGPEFIGDSAGDLPALLINDPTNQHAGYFTDETSKRLGESLTSDPAGGCDAGDIDLDGDMDIVQSRLVGGNTRQVRIWRNDTIKVVIGGYYRKGYFKDISYEIPFNVGNAIITESESIIPGPDTVFDRSKWNAAIPGDNQASVVGFASDVTMSDIDLDGDLDLVVSCIGNPSSLVSVGALNAVYVNRVVGDNWNASKNLSVPLMASSPRVTGISPRGATRGETREISVYGYNFQTGLRVDFGPGVTVTGIEQIDQLNAKVTVKIADTAAIGPRKVTVSNPTGGATSTKSGMFNVFDMSMLDTYYKNAVPAEDWTLLK